MVLLAGAGAAPYSLSIESDTRSYSLVGAATPYAPASITDCAGAGAYVPDSIVVADPDAVPYEPRSNAPGL